jgi:hypothetical protein
MTSCRRFLVASLLSAFAVTGCPQPETPGGHPSEEGGSGPAPKGGAGGARSGGSGGGGNPSGGASGSGGAGGAADASAPADTGAKDGAAGDGVVPAVDDCASAPKSLLCDPLQKMPKTIKETGLFPAAPDFSKHSPRMRKFTPDPPLWSDGLEKERFLLLPGDKKIDNTNPKQWAFPIGTVLIKTFFDDGGAGGKTRPIETRFIRRVGSESDFVEYDYYLYQWNADGTDAMLILDDRAGDDQFAPTVKITINHMLGGKPLLVNKGLPFDHTLPSRSMCGDCHRQNGLWAQTFIGFDEVRLNWKPDPGAAKTQLQEFQDAGIFMKKPAPGDPPPRTVGDADPLLNKVKRFVFGNCVHCHNEQGMVFDMAPDKFVANTVGQMTMAQSVQPPKGWLRVYPANPEMSVVFVQLRRMPLPMPTTVGGDRLRPMPPFGVNDIAADQEAVADMKAWIMSLPPKK